MVLKLITLVVAAAAVCGASGSSRIIGGTETSVENYPSVVQVEFNTIFAWTQQCAGSVLNSLYILSAAHCFSGSAYSDRDRRIRAGASDRDSGGIVVPISHAINHNGFDSRSLDSDISVVRLTTPLSFGLTIQQAAIISAGFEFPADIPVTYVGWGITSSTGASSHAEVLQEVEVQIVDRKVCAERYQSLPAPRNVTDNMLCAGTEEGGRDACTHDAGGPLIFQNILIGVISWGQGCGLADFPGVSTNVASFTQWIIDTAV